jgi:hypothetical protein
VGREALERRDEADAPPVERSSSTPGLWPAKPKSLGTNGLTPRERIGALLRLPVLNRPTNRSECKDGPRPCPWISCRHHLYLDVDDETGAIKVNFPGLERRDADEVAERFGLLMLAAELVPGRYNERPRFTARVRVGRVLLEKTGDTSDVALLRLRRALWSFLEEEGTELDLSEMPHTCSLDVADEGTHELAEVGRFVNVTMERARQLEAEGLASANVHGRREGWAERVSVDRQERARHRSAEQRRAAAKERSEASRPENSMEALQARLEVLESPVDRALSARWRRSTRAQLAPRPADDETCSPTSPAPGASSQPSPTPPTTASAPLGSSGSR